MNSKHSYEGGGLGFKTGETQLWPSMSGQGVVKEWSRCPGSHIRSASGLTRRLLVVT